MLGTTTLSYGHATHTGPYAKARAQHFSPIEGLLVGFAAYHFFEKLQFIGLVKSSKVSQSSKVSHKNAMTSYQNPLLFYVTIA
jgi:hypothetical protein